MYTNHTSIVTTLLSCTNTRLEETDSHGWTGLHYACYYNSADAIKIFGKDRRCTPAIVNMKDITKKTAVMVAVGHGNLECVTEMARLEGTDFATKNDMGQTLIDVARNYNYHKIVEFLKEVITDEGKEEMNTADGVEGVAPTGSSRLRSITDELKDLEDDEDAMQTAVCN